ncbi:Proteasome subunit alpha type-7 [Araneus ventricosus]|uniref:Proteasome subunit alpha type n=1 Tax=Araneus ventricosus TaxID=182803 RepID=A0A4Y2DJ68_ARAVE|nr:Proteasome subunit alpha type-7 [Araneus ventricosus]
MNTNRYDRAITIFSPDGHLFQVEYAIEAAKQGSTVIGICGQTTVVLAAEKKSLAQLEEDRSAKNISLLDDNIFMAFAGITADARIMIDKARLECQCHKLTDDFVTVEYITRHIATVKQRYTQSNGRRPFGFSALIAGFDYDGTPQLYQTDPSGVYHNWRATSIGQNAKTVREYLENNYSEERLPDEKSTVHFSIKALLEVVRGRNFEVAAMAQGQPLRILDADEIRAYIPIMDRVNEEEADGNV